MRVSVGDVSLYVDVEGAGSVPDGPRMRDRPTLVLLHGGPGFDHTYFKPIFSSLADEMQVLFVDQRGNGRSDHGEPEQWNLKTWASDLNALLKNLGIVRPVVLGHSFGGMVAQCFGSLFPDQLSGLILYSTSATRVYEESLLTFERLGGVTVAEAARRFFDTPNSQDAFDGFTATCFPFYTRVGWDDSISTRAVQNVQLLKFFFANEGRSLDLRPLLARVSTPTLVLAGTDDPITPLAKARELYESLPFAVRELRIFEGCRHIIHLEETSAFLAALRAFVRRVTTPDVVLPPGESDRSKTSGVAS